MSDGAFRIFALAGLLLVIVAVGSVLASWAWRMRRAGAGSTPRAYAEEPAAGSAAVPPADRGEYRGVPADPGTYASMPSGLPAPPRPVPGRSHAEPQPIVGPRPLYPQPMYPPSAYQEAAYRAAHRVSEPPPVPDDTPAYGRHHAPDPPPPDWPPYRPG